MSLGGGDVLRGNIGRPPTKIDKTETSNGTLILTSQIWRTMLFFSLMGSGTSLSSCEVLIFQLEPPRCRCSCFSQQSHQKIGTPQRRTHQYHSQRHGFRMFQKIRFAATRLGCLFCVLFNDVCSCCGKAIHFLVMFLGFNSIFLIGSHESLRINKPIDE